jgi:hypothetical protein
LIFGFNSPAADARSLRFTAENLLIHYHKTNGIVAMVVAEDSAGRRMPFGFLADLMKRVSRLEGRGSWRGVDRRTFRDGS